MLANATGESEVMVEMNTTPLIDVMLVLLVMLIITLPIQTHAVKLDMPVPNPPPPLIRRRWTTSGSTSTARFIGTTRRSIGRHWTRISMPKGKKPVEEQDEIHITANRLAKYDTVAKVMANAQRRGAVKIGIVNTNNYI